MPLPLNLECNENGNSVPFRVEVQDCSIDHLLADAREAYRVYELMMIRRPGDVWKYVWVKLIEVPESVSELIAWKMKEWFLHGQCDWPEGHVPLPKFDSLFHWCWDDTTPEAETWLTARESNEFRIFGRRLFDRVRNTQIGLRCSDDVLIQTELGALDHLQHFHDEDPKPPHEFTAPDYQSPVRAMRSSAYYEKLGALLARVDVRMVSMRGTEDYQTLRLICATQRRRALESGKTIHEALPFHIGTDGVPSLPRWNASFVEWQEGLGYADLLLDGDKNRGYLFFTKWPGFARRLAFTHHPSTREIPDFKRVEGDGWTLYEDMRPNMDYEIHVQAALDEYLEMQRRRSLARLPISGEL